MPGVNCFPRRARVWGINRKVILKRLDKVQFEISDFQTFEKALVWEKDLASTDVGIFESPRLTDLGRRGGDAGGEN